MAIDVKSQPNLRTMGDSTVPIETDKLAYANNSVICSAVPGHQMVYNGLCEEGTGCRSTGRCLSNTQGCTQLNFS